MTVIVLKTIFYLMVWSVGGAIILGLLGVVDKFDDFSYVNPIKIYKTYCRIMASTSIQRWKYKNNSNICF